MMYVAFDAETEKLLRLVVAAAVVAVDPPWGVCSHHIPVIIAVGGRFGS